MDLIMLEQWIPINCTEKFAVTGILCERQLKVAPKSYNKMSFMINSAITICSDQFTLLNGYWVMIQPVNISGSNCQFLGKCCSVEITLRNSKLYFFFTYVHLPDCLFIPIPI